MDAVEPGARRAPAAQVLLIIAVAALGAVAGLSGSIFGPWYPMVGALVVVGAGAALRRRSAEWGMLLIAFGIGMLFGALSYVLLGVFGSAGAPASGSGSS